MGSPAVLKMSFQELILFPTDSEGNAAYNNELESSTRTIQIMRFYIAINFSEQIQSAKKRPTTRRYATAFPKKNSEKASDEKNMFSSDKSNRTATGNNDQNAEVLNNQKINEEYQKIRDNDYYFILPFDFTIKMGKNCDSTSENLHIPKTYLNIQLQESLILLVNKHITKYLTSLNQHFSVMKIVQKNLHLRPMQTPKENSGAWWRYAFQAIVEDHKRNTHAARNSAWRTMKMRKYIEFFKRKQTIVLILAFNH